MTGLNVTLLRLSESTQNSFDKSIIDYLLIVIPIVISIFALCVSIRNTKQQNRIALFEKRFSVYAYMQKCLVFDRLLTNVEDAKEGYRAYCSAFGKEQSLMGLDSGWAVVEYKPIEEKLMQAFFLFDFFDDEAMNNVCNALLHVLKRIEKGQELSETITEYHKQIQLFYKAVPKCYDVLTLK